MKGVLFRRKKLMPTIPKHLGCIPDLPDHRDLGFHLPFFLTEGELPPAVDLNEGMPSIWNQGSLGSCTAHGIGAAFWYTLFKGGVEPWMPSRLMLYYMERLQEGTINVDSGAQIRTGMKVIQKIGCAVEDVWQYDISKFKEAPPQIAIQNTKLKNHKVATYRRLTNDVFQLKSALHAGNPIVIGFGVYESFYQYLDRSACMSLPSPRDKLVGGHCVLIVGYDDERKMLKCRNSWGTDWADSGYFYMPYDFASNPDFVFDLWTISLF